MASGDIVFQSNANPLSGTWTLNGPPEVQFDLRSDSNLDVGDLSLTARLGDPPYGQGWTDKRSPFEPTKSYRVTITEL